MKETRFKHMRMGDFFRPYVGKLLFVVMVTVVLSILAMLPPLLIRAVIDRVVTQRQVNLLFFLGFCLVATPILAALCQYVQTLGIAYLGQRFVFDLRIRLYNHLLRLSLRFFGKNSAGKLVNRVMGDTGTVQQTLTAQSIGVVSDLVCATFAVTATFVLNWRMATILMFVVIGFVVNYRMNIRRIVRSSRGYRASMDRLSGNVQNRLLGNVVVKSFGAETREQTAFQGEAGESMDLSMDAATSAARLSLNSQLLQQLGRAVLYFIGCYYVLQNQMTYGDVLAFTTYTVQLLGPAVRFSELIRMVQDVRIAVDRIFEVFRETPELEDRSDARRVAEVQGAVEFEDVHFHYDASEPVINGFSLTVEPGQTVALIGPTGCGKSTLLNLVMRFYDVCSGAVRIDGHDVRDIDLSCLRRQFGVVLQEPLLFDVSVLENIGYARPSATRAEIEDAARAAEIHEFILSLPNGYETVLGSEGVEMSLGQKQRLTIARAFAANPRILIMDEATSSLDSESEWAIQRAMDRLLVGRTCFIVAHRLSTIRNADLIVMLDAGVIAESGNHDQLMALENGRYRKIYEKFMGKGDLFDEDDLGDG